MSDKNSPPEDQSRRWFLANSGGWMGAAWVAANWPAIAAAAHHADGAAAMPDSPATFLFFTPAEGAQVEAIGAQIVPSGKTPGAREARSAYFIDHVFANYFTAMGNDYRQGLGEFDARFKAANSGAEFSAASPENQIAYLKTVDRTPFFETTRMFTILGMFTSPRYGGNYQGNGWKLIGFVDQHAFTPPFGYYDQEYTGFVPYPESKA